jgi:photosystem II stability/assembly factor-like uncharacterized protein
MPTPSHRTHRTSAGSLVRSSVARLAALLVAALGVTVMVACQGSAGPAPLAAPSPPVSQASGTRTLLIAISPVSDRVAWTSGAQGTWSRTTDGGATWTAGRVPGADSLQFRDVHAVDARTAYLLSIGNGPQSRIYKTLDAGAHWTLQFTNPDPDGFYDCFDFWDAQRGLVIGDAIGEAMAVLRTEDGGATWIRVPAASLPRAAAGEGSFAASGTCLETGPGGRAWIVMNTPGRSRLLRTTDYGRTWAIGTLPITTHEGSGAQSVVFRDARRGMVIGGGYGVKPGDTLVAVTEDGGVTWAPRNAPAFKVGSWGGTFVPGARVPTVVAAGPNGSAFTRDDGRTWVPIDSGNYWSVAFASPRAGWAVGTQGRITRLSGW